MDKASKIFISGATGNVGSEVARALQKLNVAFRAGDIDLERVTQRLGKTVEAARFEFGDLSTYADAFRGIKAMFLMRPPQITDVRNAIFPAIDAATAAGVERFVFLSLIGIEKNTRAPHYPIEQYLKRLDVKYTFLRCSFFMQNLNTTHRLEIAQRDEIFIPAGNSRTSFIDVRDIGAAAAVTLTQAGHVHRAYDLTGPEALDYYQVAQQFSEVLGRKITYRNPSSLAFFYRQMRSGTPLAFALVMSFLYRNTRGGMASVVTSNVERITGRKATPLRQYIQDYRQSWEK